MVSADAARARSEEEWLADLAQLRTDAKARFGDVAWVAEGSERVVYAHKCIVYARATGNWQQRFMGVPHSLSDSSMSLYGQSTLSIRTWTPQAASRRDSAASHGCSPAPSESSRSSSASSIRPIVLGSTDLDVFETSLEYFYTAGKEAEAFAVVLEGFNEGGGAAQEELSGTAKLRNDLHFCWRSKLYADVDLVLESPDGTLSTPFAAHRAILASRCPYFRSLLLGDFSDSRLDRFTLPSPPFSPPSLIFILGYIYTGTLDFSNRTFNLETVFETWRCAAFLSMSTLQDQLEARITTMSTPQRAPRIYQFACAPDVNSRHLSELSLTLIVDHFDDMWATPYIGTLDYEPQMELVSKVRDAIVPSTVAKISRQDRKIRKKMELERAGWARNVEAMLVAIEKQLVVVIANRLPEIVVSPSFISLVDGVGFSSDVLEWILLQVFDQEEMKERNAPAAYQALVGSVLLREEGIMADARMHVEDCRAGLLKYIKGRWASIRDTGAFDQLEAWCLKELADEIEVPTKDLLAGDRTLPQTRRSPPKRLLEKPQSEAVPRHSTNVGPPTRVTRPPARTLRTSTMSTASRASLASVTSRASTTSLAPSATTTATRSTTATSQPSPRTVRSGGSPATRAPVVGTTPRLGQRSATATAPRPPAASAPVSTTTGRTRTISAASTSTAASAASRRRQASPAPSTTSTVRSVAPQRSAAPARTPLTRPTPAAVRTVPAPRLRSPSTASVAPRPTPAPKPTSSPSLGNIRRQASSTSLKSTTSTRSTATAAAARSPSSASTASRRTATVTTSSPAVRARRPSASSGKSTAGVSASSSSRSVARAKPGVPAVPPLPTPSSPHSSTARARPKPPGTSLLSGIPCIVTVKGTRPIRMRAMVRYLGSMVGETGQWVGVEVPEETIPAEAKKLSWNDGKKGEIEYFTLTAPVVPPPTSSNKPADPASSDEPARRPPVARGDSLAPPTIGRQARRRSSSGEPDATPGPRKGLFVRPTQIVYVL
ncbi:hypothetical protein JCM10212_002464 [Sporobolomyces blumeae]